MRTYVSSNYSPLFRSLSDRRLTYCDLLGRLSRPLPLVPILVLPLPFPPSIMNEGPLPHPVRAFFPSSQFLFVSSGTQC